MGALDRTLHALLDTHPLWVIGIVLFWEELGIPSPVPGDLLMILGGVKVAQGVYPLWLVLLIQEIATVAGATGLYAICRRAGRPFVERYGRYIHLGPEALARAEGQIQRRGGLAIVVGRLVPGLRIVTPVAAGTLGVPPRQFIPAVALGGFLYFLVLTLLGVLLGPTALDLFTRATRTASALIALVLLVVALLVIRRLRRSLPATASIGALELLGLGARVARRPVPTVGATLAEARELSTGLHLLLAWPGFLLLAAAVGAGVALLIGRGVPAPAAFLAGTLVPLIVAALIVGPVVGRADARIARDSGAILLGTEAVRWLAYGAALAYLAPLAARLRRDAVSGCGTAPE